MNIYNCHNLAIMLFDGLSRRHVKNMLENISTPSTTHIIEAYYSKHSDSIQRSVFKDAFYGFRFVEVLIDVIKRMHPTLAYILRAQYRNSDYIFEHIQKYPKTSPSNVYEAIKSIPQTILTEYVEDVNKFIVFPVLKRHGVYSPNTAWCICINLIVFMHISYTTDSNTIETMKSFLKQWVNITTYLKLAATGHTEPNRMLKDELDIWCQLHAQHFSRGSNAK